MAERRTVLSLGTGLTFLAPAAVFVSAFIVLPFFWIAGVSFTNRSLTGAGARDPQFVGLENYLRLFNPETFMNPGQFGASLVITGQFVFWSAIVGQAVLGLLLAWMFYRRTGWLKETIQTLAIVAWIIPDVVVAFAWSAFLDYNNGTLNRILGMLGVERVDWLLGVPLVSIIMFNAWRGAAFSMLLFSSALGSIPPSYMETADVAGAGPWQKFKDIILPLIRTHIVTDLILITLWTFNTFGPFLLTGGGPAFRTEVVSILTYRMAFRFFDFGGGSAIGLIMMLINLAFALIYLSLGRKKAPKS